MVPECESRRRKFSWFFVAFPPTTPSLKWCEMVVTSPDSIERERRVLFRRAGCEWAGAHTVRVDLASQPPRDITRLDREGAHLDEHGSRDAATLRLLHARVHHANLQQHQEGCGWVL